MTAEALVTRLVQWLLDLEQVRLGADAPLSVVWNPVLPIWLLVPTAALAAFVVGTIHRRERGSRGRRCLLAGVRIGLIGVAIAILCQPVLLLQRNRTEPSYVALLVDDSQSMLLRDAVEAGPAAVSPDAAHGPSPSRIDRVRNALLADDAAALRAMMNGNRLELFAFGSGVHRTARAESREDVELVVEALNRLDCAESATDVPNALETILNRRVSGRLAAVVIATDGRSTAPGSLADAAATAGALQVPVYPLLVGSDAPPRDLAVGEIVTAENAFLKDPVAIHVPIEASGVPAGTEVHVRLVNTATGEVVAEKSVALERSESTRQDDTPVDRREITLTFRPQRPGRVELRAEVDPLAGESILENNAAPVHINVMDARMSVLYVDGYPRFEYRYLKNMLLREPTVRSSCLLLSADPDFAQEGTDPIRRFPSDIEELSTYDVVLLGDVDPTADWLSAFQADLLVEFVAERGGGLGVLCGPRSTPHRFAGTTLEKLLPVRIDPSFLGTYVATLDHPFTPRLTNEALTADLFPLSDADRATRSFTFPRFGGLFWIARTLGPKPGSEVLAVYPDMILTDATDTVAVGSADSPEATLMPLIVRGRCGAGRVLMCMTDDTWRWRRIDGGWSFDTFWLQACRSLIGPKDVGTDRRIEIRTDRRRYRYGQRVQVQAVVTDWSLLAGLGAEMNALVVDENGEWRMANSERRIANPEFDIRHSTFAIPHPSLSVRPAGVTLVRLSQASRLFEGSFVPPRAGGYRVEVADIAPLPGTTSASASFRVAPADLELRQPQADHESLTRLAAQTGGAVIPLDAVADRAAAIQDRSVQVPDDISEPLWDSKLSMLAIVTLLSTEWTLRKLFGLI